MGLFVKVIYLIDNVNSYFFCQDLSINLWLPDCFLLWGGCRVCFVVVVDLFAFSSKPNFLLQVLSICNKFLTALMMFHSVCLHLSFIRKPAEEELLYSIELVPFIC